MLRFVKLLNKLGAQSTRGHRGVGYAPYRSVRSDAMFVRLAIDQAVSLHEVDDLQQLHVEIAGLGMPS